MDTPNTEAPVARGERLVSPRDLKSIVGGLSESTIRRLIAEGRFPEPITLARNRHGRPVRIAFVESEVLAKVAEWITAHRRNRAL